MGKTPWYRTKTFKVLFQISMTLVIFFAEAITGYFTNCMALMSDSFHTLSDVISLTIGLVAIRTANKLPGEFSRKTFGNNRAEVLGGIIQAVFLYALCFNIYIEALKRFVSPEQQSDVLWILVVGGIGLAVNLMGMFLFMESGEHGHSHGLGGHGHTHGHGHSHNDDGDEEEDNTLIVPQRRPTAISEQIDPKLKVLTMASNFSLVEHGEVVDHNAETKKGGNLNTRGIFLHIMGDTLGSVAVMISAGLLWYYSTLPKRKNAEGEWVAEDEWTPAMNETETRLFPDYDNNTWLYYVDPGLTFLIATIISCSTWPLFRESTRILMEHCPEDVNLEEFQNKIAKAVESVGGCEVQISKSRSSTVATTSTLANNNNQANKSPEVKAIVHDLHIWQLNPQARAATVHVVIEKCCGEKDDDSISKYIELMRLLKKEFKSIGVTNLTIQPEFIRPQKVVTNPKTGDCENCTCESQNGGVDIEDIGKQPNKDKPKPNKRRKSSNSRTPDVSFYP